MSCYVMLYCVIDIFVIDCPIKMVDTYNMNGDKRKIRSMVDIVVIVVSTLYMCMCTYLLEYTTSHHWSNTHCRQLLMSGLVVKMLGCLPAAPEVPGLIIR